MTSSHATRRPPSLTGFFLAAACVAGLGFLPMVWASYAGASAVPSFVRPLELVMFFGPALLAIAWAAREGGRAGVRDLLRGLLRWKVSPVWYLAVLLAPGVLNLASLLISRSLGAPGSIPSAAQVLGTFLPTLGIYLVLNTEELAWRGYAWPRMRDRLGALRGSLLLGVIWGALHAPLFLLKKGHPGGWPPALFLVMTVSFSVLFALAYEGTGGSVLIAHLLHQAMNAWGDALPVYPRVTGSVVPTAIMVGIVVVVAVIAVRLKGWRWRGDATGSDALPLQASHA